MNKVKIFKKTIIASAVMAGLLASSASQAANWLMLQGTERAAAAGRAKVWGFVQAQYQQDSSDPNAGGGYIPPKLIGPNLDSQEQFNINRARLGVRGTGMPLDSTVNYFVLAELGNNGITAPGDSGAVRITDASITLNLDNVRIRTGLFKTPGPEEGLQAIHVFDYINFTTVTNQLMLERFPQAGDANSTPQPTPDANMAKYSRSVGAMRDVGIQFFDSFKSSGWEHSYALMFGNGNGLNFGDNDDNKDTYLYWSSELALGGVGPRAQGLKLFAWSHSGTRTSSADKTMEQDRDRSGFGVRYLKRPFRVGFEYMQGSGMIFQGQHRPEHIFNDEEAEGYYVDFGWYIPNSDWELDLRLDTYTRGENHPTSAASDESTFDTTTIGAQYHINKKTRINMEYSDRSFESDTAGVNAQLEGVGSRLAIQLTHIF